MCYTLSDTKLTLKQIVRRILPQNPILTPPSSLTIKLSFQDAQACKTSRYLCHIIVNPWRMHHSGNYSAWFVCVCVCVCASVCPFVIALAATHLSKVR